jgi:DNA replication licensing factor MCM6
VLFLRYTEEVAFPSTPASEPPQATAEEKLYYIEQIKALKDFELTTLYVRFDHLLEREEVLARAISNQYYRSVLYRPSGTDLHMCLC